MATGITALPEDRRSKCVVCKQMVPRYRCPRCMIRTCSLPCVKRHKAESGCTGVRDKSAYKQTSKITDIDLLSDYRFLEDVGRKAEASSRDSLNSYQKKLPWHLKGLINQAKKRCITLQLLPRKFSKRRKNNTKYYHASKAIFWTVEWVFPLADGKHYDRHMDTDTIQASLEKIFSAETDSVVRHKLRGYVQHGLDDVTLLLKKEGCPANDQRYYELHRRKTISQSLRDKVIIEYPTIYVVYGHQAAAYPRAEPTNSQISSAEEEKCSVEDKR